KVRVVAEARGECAGVLADALARAEIHGVVTNRDLLVNTLRHPEFLRRQTDTGFLERHDPAQLGAPAIDAAVHQVPALAVALAPAVHVPSPQPAGIPRGWRNVGLSIATSEFAHGREHITIALERSRAAVRAAINGEAFVAPPVVSPSPELVEFELLGVRYRVSLQRVGRHVYADSARGSSALIQAER